MGSKTIRNLASRKMHKSRKAILLEEIKNRIKIISGKEYLVGLIHKENHEIPEEAFNSVLEEKYFFSLNNVSIFRKLYKMSSDLKYNVVMAFNKETFEHLELEEIRCPSLKKYIYNKVVPWILEELEKMKRMCELSLRLVKPNPEEVLSIYNRKQTQEERQQRNKERKEKKRKKLNENVIIRQRNSEIIKKLDLVTKEKENLMKEKKKNKWLSLKDTNQEKFKANISRMNINISNTGLLIPEFNGDQEKHYQDKTMTVKEMIWETLKDYQQYKFKIVLREIENIGSAIGVLEKLKETSVLDNVSDNKSELSIHQDTESEGSVRFEDLFRDKSGYFDVEGEYDSSYNGYDSDY